MSVSERSHPHDAYDLMHEQRLSATESPSTENLEQASRSLGGTAEFCVEPIVKAVARRVTAPENPRLADDEVGRLLIWVDHMREEAQRIIDDVEKVAVIVHESWHNDSLPFDDHGSVTDEEAYADLKRRLSFHA